MQIEQDRQTKKGSKLKQKETKNTNKGKSAHDCDGGADCGRVFSSDFSGFISGLFLCSDNFVNEGRGENRLTVTFSIRSKRKEEVA
jgi:hypothetical protein